MNDYFVPARFEMFSEENEARGHRVGRYGVRARSLYRSAARRDGANLSQLQVRIWSTHRGALIIF